MPRISKNIKDTKEIAKEFLNKIKPLKQRATVVGLYGEPGAGKTAFTQATAKLLGIKKKIKSPTFVIMKKYSLPRQIVCKNFLANKTKPVSAGENFHTLLFLVFTVDNF